MGPTSCWPYWCGPSASSGSSTSRLHVAPESWPWMFGVIAVAVGLLAVATGLLILF